MKFHSEYLTFNSNKHGKYVRIMSDVEDAATRAMGE